MKIFKPTSELSRKLVLENFAFLQSQFSFPKFKKKIIKDEYCITTKKGDIEFSCLIFLFSWESPVIGILNYLEPTNFNSNLFPTNFHLLDRLDKTGELIKIKNEGPDKIEYYLKRCAELLKDNPDILDGIMDTFK